MFSFRPQPQTTRASSRVSHRSLIVLTLPLSCGVLLLRSAHAQTVGTDATSSYTYYNAATSGIAFMVPAGVTSLQIEAWGGGASGGFRTAAGTGGSGGGGGFAGETLSVTPGDMYTILVGGGGTNGGPGTGGVNGGGQGNTGGSGGGYSAVYLGTNLASANLLLVAGGGGGGGYGNGSRAGNGSAGGSGVAGGTGSTGGLGGVAGTTTTPGAGGTGGSVNGSAGSGMNGGSATSSSSLGGAGGGGYFGGGQGGASLTTGGGGGGGSSYVFSSATATSLAGGSVTAAGNNTFTDYTTYVPGAGAGSPGAVNSSTYAASGSDGAVFLRYNFTNSASAPEPGSIALLAFAGMPALGAIASVARGRRKAA